MLEIEVVGFQVTSCTGGAVLAAGEGLVGTGVGFFEALADALGDALADALGDCEAIGVGVGVGVAIGGLASA